MSRKIVINDKTQVSLIRTEEEKRATGVGFGSNQAQPKIAERIIYTAVNNVYPDPDQPRMPLLPFGKENGYLRERFISGEIDCFQVAKEWKKIAKKDKGHTKRISFLEDMAVGFAAEDGGQINPVTVIQSAEPKGSYIIETGEQRFWATVLGYVKLGMKGEVPQLKIIVKPSFSRKRQVLENRHVGPPTVVSQAREIAWLFISEGFVTLPPEIADLQPSERDPFAIHRWVAEQRKPKGSWQAIQEIMSMSPRNMRRILSFALLPTSLLARADRYNLSLRTLQEITSQPKRLWNELFDLAVNEGWTGADIEEAEVDESEKIEKSKKKLRDAHQIAFSGVKGFVRVLARSTEDKAIVISQVADEISGMKKDDAVEHYEYLASLAEQIRLRLLSRGIINN